MHRILTTRFIRTLEEVLIIVSALIMFSYPQKLSQLGHYVLNIQRPAYGGTPMPSSTKPLFDSIPLVTELIDQAYWDHAGGKGGVILVGHSVGAALAVAIAAQSDSQLPVIGLSLVGLVPTPSRSQLIPDPDPDPENPRLSPESMSAMASDFMGPMKYLNREIFSDGATLKKIFEPCTDIQSFILCILLFALTDSF